MVTMKNKSRIKDSSGQNYVGVELNLNVHFLAANALASKNVLILGHTLSHAKNHVWVWRGCFGYKDQNFGENLHFVMYTGLFGYVDWLLLKYF